MLSVKQFFTQHLTLWNIRLLKKFKIIQIAPDHYGIINGRLNLPGEFRTRHMADTVTIHTGLPTMLRFRPLNAMTPDEFYQFCRQNPDLKAELTAQGEVIFMSPSGGSTGARNAHVVKMLGRWADEDGSGIVFDSSTGFVLPNGAVRSPDTAWVSRERLSEISSEEYERFLPICPDFVIEVASPSDCLPDLQAMMDEYMSNGAQLGWLIMPDSRSVYLYHSGEPAQYVSDATRIAGEPILPGFVLDLITVWQPFS